MDVDSLERNYGMFTFEDNMRSIVMDIQCLDDASAKDNMLDILRRRSCSISGK